MKTLLAWMKLDSKKIKTEKPLAVVDIGSNTVRLVIFENVHSNNILFNEKHTCELGANLKTDDDGKQFLSTKGKTLALNTITRFSAIIRAWDTKIPEANVFMLGTSALRDSADSASFITSAEKNSGYRIKVLDGQTEGVLSALGVVSGMPDLQGIVADLGGGSLEIVHVKGTPSAHAELNSTTLPLGSLRVLSHIKTKGKRQTETWVQLSFLDRIGTLKKNGRLVCVGGSWRRIAQIYQREKKYPLPRLEGFALPQMGLLKFLDNIEQRPKSKLKKLAGDRAKVIEPSALVLRKLINHLHPSQIIFSEHGLREGLIFALRALCPDKPKRHDDAYVQTMVKWLRPLSMTDAVCTPDVLRLACHLATHFDRTYPAKVRAQMAIEQAFSMHAMPLDHHQVAFVTLVINARHRGNLDVPSLLEIRRMLTKEQARHALQIGLAIRLAHTAAGQSTQLLGQTKLHLGKGKKPKAKIAGPAALHLDSDSKVDEHLQALNAALK